MKETVHACRAQGLTKKKAKCVNQFCHMHRSV